MYRGNGPWARGANRVCSWRKKPSFGAQGTDKREKEQQQYGRKKVELEIRQK
jgi:hypothetical protein